MAMTRTAAAAMIMVSIETLALLLPLLLLTVDAAAAIDEGRMEGGRTYRLSGRNVTTRKGTVRGLTLTWDDKQLAPVELFLGVPYASP